MLTPGAKGDKDANTPARGVKTFEDWEETENGQEEDFQSFFQAEHEGEVESGWKVKRGAFRGVKGRKSSLAEGDQITKEENTQRKA